MTRKTTAGWPRILFAVAMLSVGGAAAQDGGETVHVAPKGADLGLLGEIRELARRMVELRETAPALDPPPLAVRATPDLIRISSEIRARSLVPADQMAARCRAWVDLGFRQPEFPTSALNRLAGDIAGVGLDPQGNRLLVDVDRLTDGDFFSEQPNDPTIALLLATGVRPDEPTMVHALMHLVQHHRGARTAETTTDALIAAAALQEGEANLVAVMYLFQAMGLQRNILALGYTPDQALNGALTPTALAGAPELDRRVLDFVFMEGFEALSRVWQAGGWEGVDHFIGRSRATHDLIHMDRPPARASPPEPAVPDLPERYEVRDRDSLGELGVVMLIASLTGKENLGLQAGDGWQADRLIRLEPDDGTGGVTVWVTRWRNEKEAEEFLQLYRRGLAETGPAASGAASIRREGVEVEILVIPAALRTPEEPAGSPGTLHP